MYKLFIIVLLHEVFFKFIVNSIITKVFIKIIFEFFIKRFYKKVFLFQYIIKQIFKKNILILIDKINKNYIKLILKYHFLNICLTVNFLF